MSVSPALEAGSRRALTWGLLRAALTSVSLVVLYFTLPVTGRSSVTGVAVMLLGLVGFGLLLPAQIRSITRARSPRLRAIEVLASAVPLFLLLFAMSYYLMARQDHGAFSAPLSRLDALYFTVTVFATVGFGDIVATSSATRAAVTVQMVIDLVFIGFGVRLLLGAVQVGLGRRGSKEPPPGP